jgi:hypothetical protein
MKWLFQCFCVKAPSHERFLAAIFFLKGLTLIFEAFFKGGKSGKTTNKLIMNNVGSETGFSTLFYLPMPMVFQSLKNLPSPSESLTPFIPFT